MVEIASRPKRFYWFVFWSQSLGPKIVAGHVSTGRCRASYIHHDIYLFVKALLPVHFLLASFFARIPRTRYGIGCAKRTHAGARTTRLLADRCCYIRTTRLLPDRCCYIRTVLVCAVLTAHTRVCMERSFGASATGCPLATFTWVAFQHIHREVPGVTTTTVLVVRIRSSNPITNGSQHY